jgi:hypothetical protein
MVREPLAREVEGVIRGMMQIDSVRFLVG